MALRVLLEVEPSSVAIALAIAFTYALHALVWGLAALVARSSRACAASTRHRLWKLALLGPCATAPLAALVPARFGHALARQAASLADAALPVQTASTHATAAGAWPTWIALGLAVAATLGVLRFGVALARLRRGLRSRSQVRDPRVLQHLERLCARARCRSVRLSESAEVHGPLVLGLRELCVPRGLLESLDDAELAAVLGHELAHLERHDGIWFPLAGFVQSMLWMQPLNHWVARHFRETAELACDDRAVELTGDHLGLARALVQVAQRVLAAESGRQSALVPTMAGDVSGLRSRVQRLAAAQRPSLSAAGVLERGRVVASLSACAVAALSLSVRAPHASGAHGAAAPQAAAGPGERLEALLRRDQELQGLLSQAERWNEDHRSDRDFSAWKSELEQELRHVRAEAAWTEQRAGELP